MIRIRAATDADREKIREVYLRAFPEGEGQIVARLAIDLLSNEQSSENIALVADMDGTVAGHVAFSPVTVEYNEKWKGCILAPLGVKPEYQKQGIGSELIENGIKRLSASGVDVLFVYGDPKYYGRFGFDADAASGYLPPCTLQYPFAWQAIAFNAHCTPESAQKLACAEALRDPGLW